MRTRRDPYSRKPSLTVQVIGIVIMVGLFAAMMGVGIKVAGGW